MSDRVPLVPKLTPNPENIKTITGTMSLTLIMKKYYTNIRVNRMKNGAATVSKETHRGKGIGEICSAFQFVYYLANNVQKPCSKIVHRYLVIL